MQTIRVSASKARNSFFDLLNQVVAGYQVVIEKDSKEIAVILPKTTKTDWKGLSRAAAAAKGIVKNFDLHDSPLRGKKAAAFLGRWDKA